MTMKKALTIVAAGIAIASPAALISAPDLAKTRSTLQEWVEVRKLISEEESKWKVEEQTLNESIDLLESEIEGLKQKVTDKEEQATAAQEKRQELSQKEEDLKAAAGVIKIDISSLEDRVLKMVNFFPPTLKDRVSVITIRIPKDEKEAAKLSLSHRVQNIVGILTEIEKFNNMITLDKGMRQIGESQVQVRTMYVGLSRGYYVDNSKQEAGILKPGPEGWVEEKRPDLIEPIFKAVQILDGKQPLAEFVNLPINLNN